MFIGVIGAIYSHVFEKCAFVGSDDLASRRLISSGTLNTRSEPINMSLLVIYSWLGLVAVMIVCTVIIYKYKEPVR